MILAWASPLKPDKASGYDGICNEVLCKPQITYVLYK